MSFNQNPIGNLIKNEYSISIESGRIVIIKPNGEYVLPKDIQCNFELLKNDLSKYLAKILFSYNRYSVGFYGKHKKGGVTLHLNGSLDFDCAYAIFNVELLRQKSSSKHKAGSRYPEGQFALKPNALFKKLWLAAGLTPCKSNSRYWECMGNLKYIIFEAELHSSNSGKLINKSIKPLNLTCNEIKELHRVHTLETHGKLRSNTELTHEKRNWITHTTSNDAHVSKGFGGTQTTCKNNYDKKNKEQSYQGKRLKVPLCDSSNSEWLSDYDPASELDKIKWS